MNYKTPVLVAEIGCNHMGSMELAIRMIHAAHDSGADIVKFQKRCVRELLSDEQYRAAHPDPANSYGDCYGAHREYLEFSQAQHQRLKLECAREGVAYSCSVWDMTSAREISELGPDMIKIPSASNTNFEMLRWLCENFDGRLCISLGMTSSAEEDRIVGLTAEHSRLKDLTLMACTAGYPVADGDLYLGEITRLCGQYGQKIHSIGYSGHHEGCWQDIAAYTLGAEVIERHFTLDKHAKGTDHACSLLPCELLELHRRLALMPGMLRKKPDSPLPVEAAQRAKLKYRGRQEEV